MGNVANIIIGMILAEDNIRIIFLYIVVGMLLKNIINRRNNFELKK